LGKFVLWKNCFQTLSTIGLLVDGDWLPVGRLGPDFLLLDVVAEHPPCDAVVKLRVDNVERQWRVRLPQGI